MRYPKENNIHIEFLCNSLWRNCDAVVITCRSESSLLITWVEGLNTVLSSSGTGAMAPANPPNPIANPPIWRVDSLGEDIGELVEASACVNRLLLSKANLRMLIEGVPVGVGSTEVGLEIVRVTICMWSPSCFSPLRYWRLRLRSRAM